MDLIFGLFDGSHTLAGTYLQACRDPWQVLDAIGDWISELAAGLDLEVYTCPSPRVWIHRSAWVAATASIEGPCIIGAGTQVRHGAYIRGNALVGENCVVGNSTELKNVILLDGVQVPHYNYIGDSILGYKAHMGAGAVTSNVKADRTPVRVAGGRRKAGALIGDRAEIGCGCVLNPGTVIGANTVVYPLSCVRGDVPANHIYKDKDHVIRKEMR